MITKTVVNVLSVIDALNGEVPSSLLPHLVGNIFNGSNENTGGGCMVMFINCEEHSRIGITEECVVLYTNSEDEYLLKEILDN